MSFTNEDKEWILTENAKLAAFIERVETSLLTAFHQWASPMESRVRSHSLALRALDQETETSIDGTASQPNSKPVSANLKKLPENSGRH